MVTRPALERLRPGSIDCESSSVNLTGQVPTLPRNTATGTPGESTDLATMNRVAPAAALALKPAASDTSPLTAVPEPAACVPRCRLAATILASAEFGGSTPCNRCQSITAALNRAASSSALALSHSALGCCGSRASALAMYVSGSPASLPPCRLAEVSA